MGFRCGIVGLPNVGKSTLFNALAMGHKHAEVANYPFCTIEPNVGIIQVPDERLNKIAQITKPERIVPTTLQFVDIAGLIEGSSKGEGLGNQFLAHIREVDAIIHLVRLFKDKNVSHIAEAIDPIRDVEIVNIELLLADLDTVEKRFQKVQKMAKSGEKKIKLELDVVEKIMSAIAKGIPARQLLLDEHLSELVKEMSLLTAKPVLYVANVSDSNLEEDKEHIKRLEDYASKEGAKVVEISCKIQSEIGEIENEEERQEFLKEMGIDELSLNKLIRTGYELLHLITFFTILSNEAKAWTVAKGTTALKAAGKIHTDFEKGFIKAEVLSYKDLLTYKSEHIAREKGIIRVEGKDYIVQDGDIIHFKFHL